jgi:N-acetylmuramoyl-L-alanine amidase/AmpD protein
MSFTHAPQVISPRPERKRNRRVRRRVLLIIFTLLCLLFAAMLPLGRKRLEPMPFPYLTIFSPNYDDRSYFATIDTIVLHSTVEPTTLGTVQIFLNPTSGVSAHFVVGKDGQVIQMVPVEKRAWHAGASELEGRTSVNDFSIGIEMVNRNDGLDPYPEAQIQAVAGIIRFVRSRYPIPDSRIVSHEKVARPIGRKSDPRNFDFPYLLSLLSVSPPVRTGAPSP